jgi:hypothetical protein
MPDIREFDVSGTLHIHETLNNCAFSLQQLMHKMIADNNRNGVAFIMMSAMMFSVFTVEAHVNLIGEKVIGNDWDDFWSLRKKINKLIHALDIDLDWEHDPLKTFEEMQEYRNTLAHGKVTYLDEIVNAEVCPDPMELLKVKWEKHNNPVNVDNWIAAQDQLCKQLFEAAGIEPGDLIDQVTGNERKRPHGHSSAR